jgi:hypothetical protein
MHPKPCPVKVDAASSILPPYRVNEPGVTWLHSSATGSKIHNSSLISSLGKVHIPQLAASGTAHRTEAREHLRAQLAWAQESQMPMPALFGLVAAARLLADEGEIERAV